MEVHVVVFEHRHGRDVSVFASEELAVGDGARIARQWWSEARELDASLPQTPPVGDAEAMQLYFAAQEGVEFFEISRCQVRPRRLLPRFLRRRGADVLRRKGGRRWMNSR